MKKCDLCGAENPKEMEQCTRCGFSFRRVVRDDVRDRSILDKHAGKPIEAVKREMKVSRTKMAAYLDNMAAKGLSNAETASILDEAMAFMQIPLAMGVEDELKLDKDEELFIISVCDHLERSDLENCGPIGTPGTYMRLANALQAIGEPHSAMRMIDKALLLNPKDRDAMYTRAKLFFYAKNYALAKKALGKVIGGEAHRDAAYLAELISQISVE